MMDSIVLLKRFIRRIYKRSAFKVIFNKATLNVLNLSYDELNHLLQLLVKCYNL